MSTPLARRLYQIAHLDLGLRKDVAALQADFSNLPADIFQPYSTKYKAAEKALSDWHGFSLISPKGDLYSDVTENIESMMGTYTPVIDKLPYIKACLESIGAYDPVTGKGCRTRIMRIKAGKRLTWHSHMMDGDKLEVPYAIVHIPIICPPEVRYSVISLQDYRYGDHEREHIPVHTQSYGEGECWSFNYVHMHNVFNDSEVDRITVMAYVDLRVQKTKAIFEKALAAYKGPLLPEINLGTVQLQNH